MRLVILLCSVLLAHGLPISEEVEDGSNELPTNYIKLGLPSHSHHDNDLKPFPVESDPHFEVGFHRDVLPNDDPAAFEIPQGFSFVANTPEIPIRNVKDPVTPSKKNFIGVQPKPEVEILQPNLPVLVSEKQQQNINLNKHSEARAYVLSESRSEPSSDGRSSYAYETSNGIKVQEKSYTDKDGFNVMEGSYSYTSPDGTPVSVSYIADRFGFRSRVS